MLLILSSLAILRTGGFSKVDYKNIEPKILDHVLKHVKAQAKTDNFRILSVETQVVAGINYKFQIEIGGQNATLMLWKKLDNSFEITSFSYDEKDAI